MKRVNPLHTFGVPQKCAVYIFDSEVHTNMVQNLMDVIFSEDGNIIDTLTGKILKKTQEEYVRQQFIKILQFDYGYPKEIIRREVPIQEGSKIMLNKTDGSEIRADIVVYTSKKAAIEMDQGIVIIFA